MIEIGDCPLVKSAENGSLQKKTCLLSLMRHSLQTRQNLVHAITASGVKVYRSTRTASGRKRPLPTLSFEVPLSPCDFNRSMQHLNSDDREEDVESSEDTHHFCPIANEQKKRIKDL
jgi:hypothetical protein